MTKLFVFIGLFVLAGVVMNPTTGHVGQDRITAEIMTQDNARRAVLELLREPDSAIFETVVTRNGVVCGYVNAKNGFGGYTGMREFMAVKKSATINNGHALFLKAWNSLCAG